MAKWTKGESGNPGGRPAGYGEIREIAREHTQEAIDTLVTVMQSQEASPSARVAAAAHILDRAYGRPEQSLKASVGPSFTEALERISEQKRAELDATRTQLAS